MFSMSPVYFEIAKRSYFKTLGSGGLKRVNFALNINPSKGVMISCQASDFIDII